MNFRPDKGNHALTIKNNHDMSQSIIKQLSGKKITKKTHKPIIKAVHFVLNNLENISSEESWELTFDAFKETKHWKLN